MTPSRVPQLHVTPERVRLDWEDGVWCECAAVWLADNRAEDRHPSGQRLIDVMDLPPDVRVRSAALEGDALRVRFTHDWPDFVRPLGWLRAAQAPLAAVRPELDRHPWLEGAALDARRAFAWEAHGAFLADPARRGRWLRRLARDGVAFVSDVPCREGQILDTCAAMGEVARTNYGLLFDVRAVPTPENLAYTDLGLGLHTDNPYRDPVPGFQALHALQAAPEGGDTLLADGLALALHLQRTNPAAYAVLTTTPVTFHYRSADADLCSEKPIVECAVDGSVRAVHYNNRSVAPLRLDAAAAERFYAAYRAFAALLREPRHALRLHLRDGELMVFDNRRTLHGRSEFSGTRHPRHLQGCYLTRDSVLSLAARLP